MEKWNRIIGVVLIVVLITCEQVLHLNSFTKQGFKLILLVFIPLIIIFYSKGTMFWNEYNLKQVKIKELKTPLLYGVGLYLLTLFGYFLFQSIIDTNTLLNGLEDRGIILQNIFLASLYIIFINSFIEEFFFRGFIYQNFQSINPILGYLVSALLFSFYHVLVMFGIFNIPMGILAIFGLTLVGFGLVYVNHTNKSIINSWIVHIFADLGVVTIAVVLLIIES